MSRIVGYLADAQFFCVDCAELKYNSDSITYLENNLELPVDSEGNQLTPIFTTEWEGEGHFCSCGEELR